jgi:hypothetical protein
VADRFTAEKFQWLEQITFDPHPEGRGDAVRIGFAISTFINRTTGEAWPGLDHLASMLGTNEKTVRRGIEWLEKHGHLTTKRGGKGHPTRYTLKLHDRTELSDQETEMVDKIVPESGQNCPDDRTELSNLGGQKCPTNPLSEQFEEPIDEPIESPKLKKGFASEFQEFWSAYPKKKAKGDAERAFEKARKATSQQTIMAGVLRYAAERTDQNSTYTKHPATWLNKKCWDDEEAPVFDSGETSVQRVLREAFEEATGKAQSGYLDLRAEEQI